MDKLLKLLETTNQKILENMVTDRERIENLLPEQKDQTVEEYTEWTMKIS